MNDRIDEQMTPGDPNARPAPEVTTTHRKRVSCDGGGGALGHPKVYYDLGDDPFVDCLYCDRRFVYQHDPNAPDHH